MRTIAIFQTEKQMRFRTILTPGTLFAGALTLNPSAACADVVRYLRFSPGTLPAYGWSDGLLLGAALAGKRRKRGVQ
jgi:hypothetical protein